MTTGIATYERRAAALSRDLYRIREERAIDAPVGNRSALDLAHEMGVVLDPWQEQIVSGPRRDTLVLVTRQGGKGMAATILALDQFINAPGSKTLVISKAERQAKRLFRRIRRAYHRLPNAPKVLVETTTEFELANGCEALALPGSEATIRGEDAVDLILIDEASRVPEELFAAVMPMLATTDGHCYGFTTAFGQIGWFYDEFNSDNPDWERIKVTADQIPRIKAAFLEKERRRLGDLMFSQEYGCVFLPTANQFFSSDLIESLFRDDVAPFFEDSEPTWSRDLLQEIPAW